MAERSRCSGGIHTYEHVPTNHAIYVSTRRLLHFTAYSRPTLTPAPHRPRSHPPHTNHADTCPILSTLTPAPHKPRPHLPHNAHADTCPKPPMLTTAPHTAQADTCPTPPKLTPAHTLPKLTPVPHYAHSNLPHTAHFPSA